MKRLITSSSSLAEKFGDLYDSGDYNKRRSIYDQMDTIFEKYGTEDDHVDVIFDRASEEDQKKLMQLAKQANATESSPSKEALQQKYASLANKYDHDSCTEYERGYFEALSDCIDAFKISLQY